MKNLTWEISGFAILAAREKEVLKKWVDQGGNWEPHWAYTKPKLPNIPRMTYNTSYSFFHFSCSLICKG